MLHAFSRPIQSFTPQGSEQRGWVENSLHAVSYLHRQETHGNTFSIYWNPELTRGGLDRFRLCISPVVLFSPFLHEGPKERASVLNRTISVLFAGT